MCNPRTAQLRSSLGSLGTYSVNEHDVPPMPQKPPGKGGWDTTTTTRQSARERFSKHSVSARETHSAFITMPDMVIWAKYACMLGRTGRSARLRGALIHTY